MNYFLDIFPPLTYITLSQDGKAEADDNLGKQIKRLLNFVPTISQEEFEKGLSKANQDALLITFVANLAKTQSLLTEKLNQVSSAQN